MTDSGTEPVRTWLKSMPAADRKAIGEDIKTVQIGWPIGMPVVRKLGKGLWEVRTHIPNSIARVIFTLVDDTMVLLHGFIKKSVKTPKRELETAHKRMRLVQKGA